MQARTDRRSSCSAEMFFAGAPSCVRFAFIFIQGNPDRFSTFMRAMLFPSCSLSFCGSFVAPGTPCLMFFALLCTGTPACANQMFTFATSGWRSNSHLHHRRTLRPSTLAFCHAIQAFLSLFQSQKQALKFSHGFRGT